MSTEQQKIPSIIPTEDQNLKGLTNEGLTNIPERGITNPIQQIIYKLERTALFVNRLDYFGNSIPIGAFCNAVAFIMFGFTRCHVFNIDENAKLTSTFLAGIILIFGALGQITSGLLEFLKARSYSALLYLVLGFYCFSHFFVEYGDISNYFNIKKGQKDENAFFFMAWFLIMVPLVLASLKINIFFLVQTGCTCLFFLFRWIGEFSEKKGLTEYTAGIFETIAGFASLYIFAYQIIDDEWHLQLLPSITLDRNNDIDYNIVNAKIIEMHTPQ